MTNFIPHLSKRDIARYLLLPEILPRLREFRINVEFIAYLLAMIFVMTRLLPASHPYVMKHQLGTYSIADVFGEAWCGLRIDLKHIDHVIVFGSMVLGVGLFIAMVMILIFLLFTQAAHAAAAPLGFQGFFITPQPLKDIAFEMLDRTFQIPNFFGSQFAPTSWEKVSPFGRGMHALFAFFSYGMLIVAGLIVMYYIVALLLESAQTGTPFGKRFADFYAPIRLVIAILMLIPMGGFKDTGSSTVYVGSGFGMGQYAVLSIAKWGSSLATNAWILVNKEIARSPSGTLASGELIARPNYPDLDDVLRYHTLIHSCRAIYKIKYPDKVIQPYLIRFPQAGIPAEAKPLDEISDFQNALNFIGVSGDLQIVYGEKSDSYTGNLASVRPYCGVVKMTIGNAQEETTKKIKNIYLTMIKGMWIDQQLVAMGDNWAKAFVDRTTPTDGIQEATAIHSEFKSRYSTLLNAAIDELRRNQTVQPIDAELLARGWGGAGIWFNDIAQSNGAIMSSVINTPQPVAYPKLMEHTMLMKRITNPGADTLSKFDPTFLANININEVFAKAELDTPSIDADIARFLGRAHDRLQDNKLFAPPGRYEQQNPITGYINLVFGTDALFRLQENQEVHPLAKMAAMGRGILDRALMYFGGSVVMSGLSGLIGGALDDTMKSELGDGSYFGPAFDNLAAGMTAFAMVGVTVGFVLYYVIPMLPFMYFFFAVGRWVKGIFEAMVCIPLWALAHLRIDGDGISGQAAANGYFIVLELFLRPILTLFGLMAAVSIFSAQAIVMESVFDLVTDNVTGHVAQYDQVTGAKLPTANPIDQFFFTVMYAVLLYIMALASFKLIDLIPHQVLRFMGSQAGAFRDGEQIGAQAEQTIQMTGIGGYQIADDVAKAGQQAAKAAGETVAVPVNVAMPTIMNAFKGSMRGGQGGGGDPG